MGPNYWTIRYLIIVLKLIYYNKIMKNKIKIKTKLIFHLLIRSPKKLMVSFLTWSHLFKFLYWKIFNIESVSVYIPFEALYKSARIISLLSLFLQCQQLSGGRTLDPDQGDDYGGVCFPSLHFPQEDV